jgi:hypothetical protein
MFQSRQHLQCRGSGVRPERLQPDMLQTCRQVAAVVAWRLSEGHAAIACRDTCTRIYMVQPQRHNAELQDCNFRLGITSTTCTATCDTTQPLHVHMRVELGMCCGSIRKMAQ